MECPIPNSTNSTLHLDSSSCLWIVTPKCTCWFTFKKALKQTNPEKNLSEQTRELCSERSQTHLGKLIAGVISLTQRELQQKLV